MPDLQTAFPPLRAAEGETPFAGREAGLAEAVEAAVSRPLWRRRPLVLALTAALLAGLAVLVGVLATGGSPGRRPIAVVPNSIAVIDPRTDNVLADTPIGTYPGVTVGEGRVWAMNCDDGTASVLDPKSYRVDRTLAVGGALSGIAGDQTAVWASDPVGGKVLQIDPQVGVGQSLKVAGGGGRGAPGSLAMGYGAVWVRLTLLSTSSS
jgi:hypothetical protein